MRVKREVASITLSSTLWRTRIISVRATLWRIATASAWQWGSEGATAGCDRDEWRPGGLRSNPSSVHLFTVGGLLRKTGQQGERCWHCSGGLQAESRVNKFPKDSLWCIIVFTSIVCPYGGSCCILFRNDLLKLTVVQFVMSQWDTDWEHFLLFNLQTFWRSNKASIFVESELWTFYRRVNMVSLGIYKSPSQLSVQYSTLFI